MSRKLFSVRLALPLLTKKMIINTLGEDDTVTAVLGTGQQLGCSDFTNTIKGGTMWCLNPHSHFCPSSTLLEQGDKAIYSPQFTLHTSSHDGMRAPLKTWISPALSKRWRLRHVITEAHVWLHLLTLKVKKCIFFSLFLSLTDYKRCARLLTRLAMSPLCTQS